MSAYVEIPRGTFSPVGCTCGGMTSHQIECPWLALPIRDQECALGEANARLNAYIAFLNGQESRP